MESLVTATEAPAEVVEGSAETSEATEQQASWYWGEGVEGQGDAPDWFMGQKYKSIADQAKGYNDLWKKYNERVGAFTGSPEEGYAMPEGAEEGNELLNMLTQIGAKYNMNQDMFNELVENYDKIVEDINTQSMAQKEERIKGELQKLGENADARLRNIADYAKGNFDEETAEELISMVTTAKSVEILEKLIGNNKPSKVADPSRAAPVQTNPFEELHKMQFATDDKGNRLMDVDPIHRKKYNELVAKLNQSA